MRTVTRELIHKPHFPEQIFTEPRHHVRLTFSPDMRQLGM